MWTKLSGPIKCMFDRQWFRMRWFHPRPKHMVPSFTHKHFFPLRRKITYSLESKERKIWLFQDQVLKRKPFLSSKKEQHHLQQHHLLHLLHGIIAFTISLLWIYTTRLAKLVGLTFFFLSHLHISFSKTTFREREKKRLFIN